MLQHTATLQHTVTNCNTLQHTVTHCNTRKHTAIRCNTLQHTATYCNTLQHTSTRCNTLQHSTTLCNTLQHTATLPHTDTHRDDLCLKKELISCQASSFTRRSFRPNTIWCWEDLLAIRVVKFGCVLQCVAVCCSVLQCAALVLGGFTSNPRGEVRVCTAVCWSVLQCVAVS